MIQNLLRKDPEAGLLDLGANIGVYTLSIAKMGRKVRKTVTLISEIVFTNFVSSNQTDQIHTN